MDLTIDSNADKTLSGQLYQQFAVLALAIDDQWSQQQRRLTVTGFQHRIDHLAGALGLQIDPVVRAARQAGACVEQTQVVVDLGDGADGGAGVV